MIKISFISKPRLSGDYSHFKYLRDNLEQYKFYLVGLGYLGQLDEEDRDFIHLGSHLDRLHDQKALAELFVKFHQEKSIDIIIPVDSPIAVSCIPFLKNTSVIHVVNLDSNRLYKYVTSYLNIVSKIICISVCQLDALRSILDESLLMEKVVLIPHGVKTTQDPSIKIHSNALVIGYIGRLHHGHKGILWIPKILRKLRIPFHFEIIGEGKDQAIFMDQLKKHQISYINYGYVSHDNINSYLDKWDILLFPSQIEGFGLTLIEAMNNGIVPIANYLPGITDYIIDSEKDGFLVTKNRVSEFVRRIEQLNKDRNLLHKMKIAAKEKVKSEFDLQIVLAKYVQVFEDVLSAKKPREAKNFSEWVPFVEYTPGLGTKLMNRIRKIRDFVINQLI